MNAEKSFLSVPLAIVLASLVIAGAVLIKGSDSPPAKTERASGARSAPHAGGDATLSFSWGDLGARLVSVGVIDRAKLEDIYLARGGLSKKELSLLEGAPRTVVMDKQNASFLLSLLWALGLAQKSAVLEKGEMVDPRFGGADRFASTGGWTIASGMNPMDHYSRHMFFTLSPEAEGNVHRVAKGIFRPCCDNSTHFPDCNHGMAMLGLLELLASEGASEEEMYEAALAANTLWFPDQYAVIDEYRAFMEKEGRTLSPRELLGKSISSASGFNRVVSSRGDWNSKPQGGSGGGCSV